MNYVAAILLFTWIAGLYVLATRSRDGVRLALDNPAPNARPSDFVRFSFRKFARNIDPERLSEAGRVYLKSAIRTEDILYIWMFNGFWLLVWIAP